MTAPVAELRDEEPPQQARRATSARASPRSATQGSHYDPDVDRMSHDTSPSWAAVLGHRLRQVLADAGNEVLLWGKNAEVAAIGQHPHENPVYHPGIELPPSLRATLDVAEALAGAEIVVLALPSQVATREPGRVAFTPRRRRRSSSA